VRARVLSGGAHIASSLLGIAVFTGYSQKAKNVGVSLRATVSYGGKEHFFVPFNRQLRPHADRFLDLNARPTGRCIHESHGSDVPHPGLICPRGFPPSHDGNSAFRPSFLHPLYIGTKREKSSAADMQEMPLPSLAGVCPLSGFL
jgi:hypothetical protein